MYDHMTIGIIIAQCKMCIKKCVYRTEMKKPRGALLACVHSTTSYVDPV